MDDSWASFYLLLIQEIASLPPSIINSGFFFTLSFTTAASVAGARACLLLSRNAAEYPKRPAPDTCGLAVPAARGPSWAGRLWNMALSLSPSSRLPPRHGPVAVHKSPREIHDLYPLSAPPCPGQVSQDTCWNVSLTGLGIHPLRHPSHGRGQARRQQQTPLARPKFSGGAWAPRIHPCQGPATRHRTQLRTDYTRP